MTDEKAPRSYQTSAHDTRPRLFIEAYFSNGFNATSAAMEVYKCPTRKAASVLGTALLRRPEIAVEVIERRDGMISQYQITAERTLAELARLAYGRMSDFISVQEDGTAVIDLSAATEDQLAMIAELTVEVYVEGEGDFAKEVKRTKIKLHNKLGALDKLMKYHRLYDPANEGDTPDDGVFTFTMKIGNAVPTTLTVTRENGALTEMRDVTPVVEQQPETFKPNFGTPPNDVPEKV